MIINKFDDEQTWKDFRRGKITGTRLKDIIAKKNGNGKKIGYYELIAEKLALAADDENCMDRGLRLEKEAIQIFEKKTGKKVNTDLVIWQRDDNQSIAISPDGYINEKEAVEVKCLGSARFLEALLINKIPSEYEFQVIQYFVCNDDLKTLYFIFYDPRIVANPFFYFTVTREELKTKIAESLEFQRKTLAEIDEIILRLSF